MSFKPKYWVSLDTQEKLVIQVLAKYDVVLQVIKGLTDVESCKCKLRQAIDLDQNGIVEKLKIESKQLDLFVAFLKTDDWPWSLSIVYVKTFCMLLPVKINHENIY